MATKTQDFTLPGWSRKAVVDGSPLGTCPVCGERGLVSEWETSKGTRYVDYVHQRRLVFGAFWESRIGEHHAAPKVES